MMSNQKENVSPAEFGSIHTQAILRIINAPALLEDIHIAPHHKSIARKIINEGGGLPSHEVIYSRVDEAIRSWSDVE